MRGKRFTYKVGRSLLRDEKQAVSEFYNAVCQPDITAVIFFCSSNYDLNILGKELAEKFDCTLIGCTTAGELSSFGYQDGGIVGASISSDEMKVRSRIITNLGEFSHNDAGKLASDIRSKLSMSAGFDKTKMFGFLLIDGLSVLEQKVISSLHSCFGGISIFGGSAGDDLKHQKTYVYNNGKFISDAAVFTVFETTLLFVTFMINHYRPTDIKLVVTGADAKNRIITEINGRPAALEYARVLGVNAKQFNARLCAKHPLMIRIGGEWYVRSVKKCNEDNSLTLSGAIEEGIVLTVGESNDVINSATDRKSRLDVLMSKDQFFIFCECVLRKLEFRESRMIDDVNKLLSGIDAIGFSTYGEQFNSIHVNQTLTGVVIGG